MSLADYSNGSSVVDNECLVDISGLSGVEYDIVLDDKAEDIVSEYVDKKKLDDGSLESAEKAVGEVRSDFDHVTTLARENSSTDRDLDHLKSEIDKERRESQGRTPEKIRFSNVLEGEYDGKESSIVESSEEGYIAGGCVEKAIMMNYVLKDLGFDSELKMGDVEVPTDKGATFVGHAWTEMNYQGKDYVVDPSLSTEFDLEEKNQEVSDQYLEKSYGVKQRLD